MRRNSHPPHRPFVRPLSLAVVLGWACGAAAASAADNEPAATPFRPTVASGANLSAPGWLEVEFGGQWQGGQETPRRDSLPYLLKYSLNERYALLVGGEARVRLEPPGASTVSGRGDTTLAVKYRAPDRWEGVTLGLEAGVKLPTAVDGAGSGERDLSVKAIHGLDLPAGWHLDTNLAATHLGEKLPGTSTTQWAWAAALSHPVGESWTVAADLSGTRQAGVPSTLQLLGAASHVVSPRVVIDAGLAAGLNRHTPRWTAFAGVTVLLGRLN